MSPGELPFRASRATAPRAAELKLLTTLFAVLAVSAIPTRAASWALLALPVELAWAWRAGLRWSTVRKALTVSAPLVLGVASLAWFQHDGHRLFWGLLAKSSVSLLGLQLLIHSTPAPELLRVLRRWHVPALLCDTMALLHRYSFVLAAEAQRMRRARAGRTWCTSRLALWQALAASIGLLFVRSVARAERVHTAMRSRGGA